MNVTRDPPSPASGAGPALQRLRSRAEAASHQAQVAKWVYATSPAYFDFLFGGEEPALRNLASWLSRENSEFSWRRCRLLTLDGRAVGCLIAVPGAEIAQRRRADTLALIKECPAAGRAGLLGKLAGLQGALESATDGLYIRSLSVDTAFRGRGYGKQFLQMLIEEAASFGIRRFSLDVEAHNVAARSLYERVGFAVTRSWEFAPMDMVIQSMSLVLENTL
jgi:ribosomal protein S18 acetylase RimI-like enzyme